jgi:uncharacterized phage protein gp47/JayE
MPLAVPAYSELYDTFRTEMEQLGFTHWAEGSRIGAIGRVLAAYMVDLWSTLSEVEAQGNPSTARGLYLDRLGEMFGVLRLPPQAASTVGKGPAVQFTNNGATTVTLPTGTRVWASAQPEIGFQTVQSLTLGAGQQGFVDLVAVGAGEAFNVGAGQLNSHNAGMGQSSVTNIRPVGGGTFTESDAAYRFRIKEALAAKHGATEGALRQACLSLPGVRDALVSSGGRGAGTLDVMLVPIDRYASDELLSAAAQAVGDTVAAGISWRVMTPRNRRIDVRVQLRLTPGVTLADQQAPVEAAIRGYIDNLRVNDGFGGSDLIYNELVSRVQDASTGILDSVLDLTVDSVPSLQTNVATRRGERLISGVVSVL